MIPLQRTWVVVPTYNEREALGLLLPELLTVPNCVILGVDDASRDGTGALWDAWRTDYPDRIQVIHRSGKLGLGTAYLAAFQYCIDQASTEWIVQMDADGSHRVEDLRTLLMAAPSADLVVGSRYVAGATTPGWPRWRKALSRGGSWYSRQVLQCPVRDLTAGFKVWRAAFLNTLPLDQITATGYGFQIAMTMWAYALGGIVREVPICFPDRVVGTSKMSPAIMAEALGLVWQLRAQQHAYQRQRQERTAIDPTER